LNEATNQRARSRDGAGGSRLDATQHETGSIADAASTCDNARRCRVEDALMRAMGEKTKTQLLLGRR
jgi:hypothetical protein